MNAFALAKVVVAKFAHRRAPHENLPLLYAILLEAAVFAVITIAFHMIEETLIGVWRGKPLAEAVPTLGDGSLEALIMLSLIVFVALIPFFGFLELEEAIGPEQLRCILSRRKNHAR